MFNIGGGELLVILLVALIVLGPQRLPGAARQAGKVMGDLRRISSGFQQELKEAFDDDSARPRRREATPLASTVAEVDGRPAPSPDGLAGSGGGAPATDESSVPPAVAAALDEIVTPLDQPPAGPDAPPASAPAPSAEPDGLGDERAAS